MSIPNFDDLPSGCAWGAFDKNGKKYVYGTLNLITPEAIKYAAAEVHHDPRVFFRKSLCHKVTKLEDPRSGSHFGFDDEPISCNPQPTIEGLQAPDLANQLPTLDHWHQRGCVTGRGVLVDFKIYAEFQKMHYDEFSSFRIGIKDLEAVAAWRGLTFRTGDIFLIRFGVTETLGQMSDPEQEAAMSTVQMCGLEGGRKMTDWLWDRHFAAVVSDNMAVEAMPPKIDGVERPPHELVLHQWCLSLLGIPLGVLWDLKALGEAWRERKQYSFLLTSSPLNYPGAVGRPPNALAIL